APPRSALGIEALLARIEQLGRSAGLGGDPASGGAARGAARGAASAPAPDAREQRGAPAASGRVEPAPEQEPIGGETPTAVPVQEIAVLWPAMLERVRALDGGAMLAALL